MPSQTKLQTTLPEINAFLFDGSLPQLGLTLITGGAECGKTVLAVDIVREFLRSTTRHVIVATETLSIWRRAFEADPHLHLHDTIPAHLINDLGSNLGLIVMDGAVIVSGQVVNYSRRGPVIITSIGTSTSVFQESSALTLHLSRVTVYGQVLARLTDTKNVVHFKIVEGKPVPQDYVEPVVQSAWERLLKKDLI